MNNISPTQNLVEPVRLMVRGLIYVLTLLLLASCAGNGSESIEGLPIETRYAQLLRLTEGEGYVCAEVINPWDTTKVLHRYLLVERDAQMPDQLPEGDVVRVPLTNAAVASSVHCSLIDQLGGYASIGGVCDLQYISMEKVQSDYKQGRIKDVGDSMNPNVEAVIDLQPDAILLSPFQNSGSYGKLGKLNIPIIECADYMETGPLARAEWMRFYGMLVGRAAQADSLFADVEKRYNDLKDRVGQLPKDKRPTVAVDVKYGSVWYVPGGQSTIGRLLADAGAAYVYADTKESGSLEFSPEAVFEHSADADFWVLRYSQATPKTYAELASDYANNANMRAFREHRVYGCNNAMSRFYEETPFHPDLLLSDFVSIFHPNLLPSYKRRYFLPLQ